MIDPMQNFIACADLATKLALEHWEEAHKAETQDRIDYWTNEARNAERRARFYLMRANEFNEERSQGEAA